MIYDTLRQISAKNMLILIYLHQAEKHITAKIKEYVVKRFFCVAAYLYSVGIEIGSSSLFVHVVGSIKPTMVLYLLQCWSFPITKNEFVCKLILQGIYINVK